MGNDNTSSKIIPDKQVKADTRFKPGVSGNPAGRPKRKTLTELIHAKLDSTPGSWDAIVNTVITKVIKDKEKEIIRTFWQYTDGMPTQRNELTGKDGDAINIKFTEEKFGDTSE